MPNNDFLIHYGVKGQKWGVRKYQNEDGTLTSEGRERYGIGQSGGFSKVKKRLSEAVDRTTDSVKSKIRDKVSEKLGPSHMSDSELNDRLARMRKEAEYARLQREISGKNNGGGDGKGKNQQSGLKRILWTSSAVVVLGGAMKKIYQGKVDDLFERNGNVKMSKVMKQMANGSKSFEGLFDNLVKTGAETMSKKSYGTVAKDAAESAAKKAAKEIVRAKFRKGGSLSDLGLKDASETVVKAVKKKIRKGLSLADLDLKHAGPE